MDDADDFPRWCAKRNVSLIMHGHKHLQRHVERAIDCGEVSGLDGLRLLDAVHRWVPRAIHSLGRTLAAMGGDAATLYEDPGDGSGFARRYVALHAAE